VATPGLVELGTGTSLARSTRLALDLPAYGYRLFLVKPAQDAP
jgi:hypothetical protein